MHAPAGNQVVIRRVLLDPHRSEADTCEKSHEQQEGEQQNDIIREPEHALTPLPTKKGLAFNLTRACGEHKTVQTPPYLFSELSQCGGHDGLLRRTHIGTQNHRNAVEVLLEVEFARKLSKCTTNVGFGQRFFGRFLKFLPHSAHGFHRICGLHRPLVARSLPRRVKVQEGQRVEVLLPIRSKHFEGRCRNPIPIRVGEGRLATELVVGQPDGSCYHRRDGYAVNDMARNARQFRPQLQVNMRGRLKRVTHHQQGHQRILSEVKQPLGLLNFGPHDALDGTDFPLQRGQLIFWPKGRVGLIPAMVCGCCCLFCF